MVRTLATTALAALSVSGPSLGVSAGQVESLPASGMVRFQVSYVQYAGRDVQLDDSAGFGTIEFVGVTRNVEGKPWFDRMTEQCTGQYYWGEKKSMHSNGSCVYLDADGDKVMVNWTAPTPMAGAKHILGGTGKYAGIAGEGTYTNVELKTPAEGVAVYLTEVELDFQIKQPSQ